MIIYEDKLVTATLPEKPATKGHVHALAAKTSIEALSEQECAHLLSLASFTANALFEQVGASGTNIILTDLEGVRASILARTDDDGLSLQWQPQQLSQEEMDSIAARIKDRCDYIGHEEESQTQPAPKPQRQERAEEKEEEKKPVKNYLLKQLDRTP
ncbi:hypothetical protein JXA12_01265 [Candidatus Woesearchaeota archaeon]|nr:hypothetical protein [Candidatus Woesearchaeota archaeon]